MLKDSSQHFPVRLRQITRKGNIKPHNQAAECEFHRVFRVSNGHSLVRNDFAGSGVDHLVEGDVDKPAVEGALGRSYYGKGLGEQGLEQREGVGVD